jgi:MFS family permease
MRKNEAPAEILLSINLCNKYVRVLYATVVIWLAAFEWNLILSFQILSAIVLKIPGAWVADKFGKKRVLVISALTWAIFTIVFTFSPFFC